MLLSPPPLSPPLPPANLYSLRGEHEKAVTYFEMAIKVNLNDQSAWVLLGHEYLELKNLTMSVEAYSKAIGEDT